MLNLFCIPAPVSMPTLGAPLQGGPSEKLAELAEGFGKAPGKPVSIVEFIAATPIGNPVLAWDISANGGDSDIEKIKGAFGLGEPSYRRASHPSGMLSGFELYATPSATVVLGTNTKVVLPPSLYPAEPAAPKKAAAGALKKVASTPGIAAATAAMGTGGPGLRGGNLTLDYLGGQTGIPFRTVTLFYPLKSAGQSIVAGKPLIKLYGTSLKGAALLAQMARLVGAKRLTVGRVLGKVDGKTALVEIKGSTVKITAVRYGSQSFDTINVHAAPFETRLLATSG